MKIYVDGKDNMGWSIDRDRSNLFNSISRLRLTNTKFIFNSDIVHNIWWSNLKYNRFYKLINPMQKVIVTASNFIDLEDDGYALKDKFEKVKLIADGWISPSAKQKRILEKNGLKVYYQPFYLDIELFNTTNYKDKSNLLEKFNIPKKVFDKKIIIGSFQRDSLGSDLSKPKWQKGPDILIELLKDLPKDRFILLLAGPRRHWVINQCKKNNIPYYFIGQETIGDDIKINTLSIEDMPLLYYLTDIYLVTSKSEGGPKAIMEATATKTFIYSTDVGLASDFLDESCVFTNIDNYKKALYSFVVNFERQQGYRNRIIEKQYKNAIEILNYDAMDRRLINIYQDVLSRIRK